jgi:ATP-dependent Lon protease
MNQNSLDGNPQQRYAVLPLHGAVLFPYTTVNLQITRARSLRLVQQQLDAREEFMLVRSTAAAPDRVHADDLASVGVVGRIIRNMVLPNGSLQITVEGICRARTTRMVQTEPYFIAEAQRLQDTETTTPQTEHLAEEALAALDELLEVDPHYARETGQDFRLYLSHPGQFADLLGAEVHFPPDVKQRILESLPWRERLNRLIKYLKRETERAQITEEFVSRTRRSLSRERREVYLRQQLKEIRRELGEEDPQEQEYHNIVTRVNELPIPDPVRRQITAEADRMRLISTASAEYGSLRSYLDWSLALPWNAACDEAIPLAKVEHALNENLLGLNRAKERMLDHLAERRSVGAQAIVVLAGPPGVGKTTIAQTIADALGRPFVKINAAGATTEGEILGHRRTFLGAQPGIFVRRLCDAGVCNPVILVDNIDRVVEEYSQGNVPAVLLSVLHPARSARFVDRFLNFPFDLSQAIFITTASSADEIPDSFSDHLDIIELPGYIEPEKLHIAEKHLVPKLLDRYRMSAFELQITQEGLRATIRNYTLEAGLAELIQSLEAILRKCTRQRDSGYATQWRIDAPDITSYLGAPLYIPEVPESQPEIGVAMGVAWTQAGGDLMLIEGLKMPGTGQIVYTGSLGEVMKESVQAAYSYVRAKADVLQIDPSEFESSDVHIHFPSGSIPKDGPSAGLTVTLVIASVMSNRPVRHDLAMTGEVTLRGKIIAVGGLKEKVAAAARAGLTQIIIPRENEKDLQGIPDDIRRSMTFHMVERVDEVFGRALLEPEGTSISLTRILEQEVERVKRRERRKKKVAGSNRGTESATRPPKSNRRRTRR